MNDRRPDGASDPERLPERATFRSALVALERSLLRGEATRSAADRRSAAGPGDGEGPLAEYLQRVRLEAYAVTDEEVAELRRNGHSDDELFELTVCAAFGAARRQLDAGLAALAEAYDSD